MSAAAMLLTRFVVAWFRGNAKARKRGDREFKVERMNRIGAPSHLNTW